MQVTVRLVGVVQHLLREPELRLDLPDRCTPEEMFDHLIAGLGPSLQTYLSLARGASWRSSCSVPRLWEGSNAWRTVGRHRL
ncbi:MAG: hypothetical protein HYV08_18485 [Deltaproteobacteria bacterium]|nr:hypothetical protein [Deltaproteobacteria bacterium]